MVKMSGYDIFELSRIVNEMPHEVRDECYRRIKKLELKIENLRKQNKELEAILSRATDATRNTIYSNAIYPEISLFRRSRKRILY